MIISASNSHSGQLIKEICGLNICTCNFIRTEHFYDGTDNSDLPLKMNACLLFSIKMSRKTEWGGNTELTLRLPATSGGNQISTKCILRNTKVAKKRYTSVFVLNDSATNVDVSCHETTHVMRLC